MEGDDERLRARLEALFREELQDNMRVLADGLARLQEADGEGLPSSLLQELFRAAHSLKGAAHAAGVTAAVEPCRRLEQSLADVRAGDRAVDDTLVQDLAADVDELLALDRALDAPTVGPPVPGERYAAVHASLAQPRTRVAVDALEDLVHEAGALVSATQQLHALAASLDQSPILEHAAAEAADVARKLDRAGGRIAEMAQQLRMQSIANVTSGLEQAVRELCRTTGKQAELTIEGADVELDRDVGDAIRDPLLHLVRNAIDHGIEHPEERDAAGKPAIGSVRVSAHVEGARVLVTVADDGAGVDVDALRSAAGTSVTSDDDLDLAFEAGVSTAPALTDVSGRGIGLDAVRSRVESLGGTVLLRSSRGNGTEVVMAVPVTLSVVRIVIVRAGGEAVAIPAAAVSRLHRVDADQLRHLEGAYRVALLDRVVPAVDLADALGLAGGKPDDGHVVLVELADQDTFLIVDGVDAEHEALLQQVPPRATAGALTLGAVILPSGSTVLVANPAACARLGTVGTASERRFTGARQRVTVLLAEDTLTTRALERSILEGAGYEVVEAADGADAWRLLNERAIDIVVSDVDMPRMGGIELCTAIRSSPRLSDVPVVLVTSLATDDDRRRGIEAGASAYLVKSAFEQAALLDALRRLQ